MKRFSKTLYFDPVNDRIDEEISTMLDSPRRGGKGRAQDFLRDRIRTGHIIHQLLGDATAASIQDIHGTSTADAWDMLEAIIKHAHYLQNRTRPAPAVVSAPTVPAFEPEQPAPAAKAKRLKPLPLG